MVNMSAGFVDVPRAPEPRLDAGATRLRRKSVGSRANLEPLPHTDYRWPKLDLGEIPEIWSWKFRRPKKIWEQIEILKNNIPNCELKVFKGYSHNVHLEIPDKFNKYIDDFLKK